LFIESGIITILTMNDRFKDSTFKDQTKNNPNTKFKPTDFHNELWTMSMSINSLTCVSSSDCMIEN
jgi:hypothetical protein